MNGSFERFNFRAKAVLCVLLMAAMHVVVGCGGTSGLLPGGDSQIPLTPDQPLAKALAGTSFSNATAVVINPATGQFGVVFPNGTGQQISGTIKYENGQAQVSRLTVADGSKSVTITFGANQEITNIATSAGLGWQRSTTAAKSANTARANTLESYMAANADLIQYAQQLDSGGVVPTDIGQPVDDGSGTVQTVKTNTALTPLAVVLGAMIFIPLSIGATIIFILEVVVAMNFLGLP
jgi:hypothetical protein